MAKRCPVPHLTLVLCSIRLLAEVEGEWWPQAAEPSLSLWALCLLHSCPPPAVLALGFELIPLLVSQLQTVNLSLMCFFLRFSN